MSMMWCSLRTATGSTAGASLLVGCSLRNRRRLGPGSLLRTTKIGRPQLTAARALRLRRRRVERDERGDQAAQQRQSGKGQTDARGRGAQGRVSISAALTSTRESYLLA